jgi:hypothetical protein
VCTGDKVAAGKALAKSEDASGSYKRDWEDNRLHVAIHVEADFWREKT